MYFICKESAFTLIELVITLAILAIIISLAVPSYHTFMERQEYSQLLPLIRNQVNLSKNYAAVYHHQIVICASTNLESCENNQWHKGMLIFSDQNNNKIRDSAEMLEKVYETHLKYGSLKWEGNASNPNSITFMGDTGLPRGSPGSFYYCSFNTPKNHTRYVVNQMGHVRAETSKKCA